MKKKVLTNNLHDIETIQLEEGFIFPLDAFETIQLSLLKFLEHLMIVIPCNTTHVSL